MQAYLEGYDEIPGWMPSPSWLQLRRLTGRKVSKSEIVAEALRALVADVEQKGERSSYAKRLR